MLTMHIWEASILGVMELYMDNWVVAEVLIRIMGRKNAWSVDNKSSSCRIDTVGRKRFGIRRRWICLRNLVAGKLALTVPFG